MKKYNHRAIEQKWQRAWAKQKLYQVKDNPSTRLGARKKYYALVEFPYPSGEGLHVGHIRSYTAMDVIARQRRAEGYEVLYPMGWDAFGLPTENYAIKTGRPPALITRQNINRYRKQLQSLGFSFDWSREINTSDPNYYRWTQWMFLQLFKAGLAYKAKMPINWCSSCEIGLANEEVIDERCERCGGATETRDKEQWLLAITKYADRLDRDLDLVDYPESIKAQQRNWIGRSEGVEIKFPFNKKFKYVIFHGFQGSPNEQHYIWLKSELEKKGHEVVMPELPNTLNPKESEQVGTALKATNYDENTIIYGHSLGSVVALKVCEKLETPIAGLILSGAFVDPKFLDKDRTFKNTFNWAFDVEKIKSSTGFIKAVHDIRDTAVSAGQCERMEKLLGITADKVIAQLPHFDGEQEPELLKALTQSIKIFTTRPETIFGVTFIARHGIADRFTGEYAINPANQEKIPIWEAEYVMKTVGTGAIMGVPAHDERDFEFAKKHNLPIKEAPLAEAETLKKIGARPLTTYKLRDWVFSRQRYWGEPIPLVFCAKCALKDPVGRSWVAVPEKDLPVKLPPVKKYQPTRTGESPLAGVESWVKVKCPKCGGPARRETDTMPNWAGSSWYYLAYIVKKATSLPVRQAGYKLQATSLLKKWLPVDWYNGGLEQTTLHLLYSRFWHKALYDLRIAPGKEPYAKRTSHGLILASDGQKMSKSRGNVVNPDAIVKRFGADTLRVYEMFMGPFDQAIDWHEDGLIGARRFLERVWRLTQSVKRQGSSAKLNVNLQLLLNQTIQKVSGDIEMMKFNTAISALMILLNNFEKAERVAPPAAKVLIKLLSPFAPHLAEELWHHLGEGQSVQVAAWPRARQMKNRRAMIAVQINGKTREVFEAVSGLTDEELKELALNQPKIKLRLAGKTVKRIILVPNRLINIVLDKII